MQQRPGFDSHNNFFRRRIRPHRGFAAPFFTPRFCCAVPPPPHQPLPRRWRVGVSRHFSLQNKLDYGAYFTKPFFTYLLATKKNHIPGNWNKKKSRIIARPLTAIYFKMHTKKSEHRHLYSSTIGTTISAAKASVVIVILLVLVATRWL